MIDIRCFYPMCNESDELFRVNAKGVEGVWACRHHVKNTDARIDPEVDALVRAISNKENAE
jgi:hypothetical protein